MKKKVQLLQSILTIGYQKLRYLDWVLEKNYGITKRIYGIVF